MEVYFVVAHFVFGWDDILCGGVACQTDYPVATLELDFFFLLFKGNVCCFTGKH